MRVIKNNIFQIILTIALLAISVVCRIIAPTYFNDGKNLEGSMSITNSVCALIIAFAFIGYLVVQIIDNKPEKPLKIKIKYFEDIEKIEKISVGDLIDLRAAEDVELKAGEFKLISLGVGMKLPDGFKANIYPRSSTFKNFGIILANSVGQIDNSYSGNEDCWMFPALAMRDTVIHKNDRICQFEIQKVQPVVEFEEVKNLSEVSRGGIGSTGTK